MTKALVLGGGGVTGTAWEIGLLKGLADRGARLARAELILATSSGALTAALLTSGRSLEELYEEQLTIAVDAAREPFGSGTMFRTAWAGRRRGDDQVKRAAIGAAAVRAARARSAEENVAANAARLPEAWPDRDLRITAVRADTGELRVFTGADGVPLARAVTASAATPFVRPPVDIDGVLYVDGGIRSTTNADLATGVSRVVVLAPLPRSRGRGKAVRTQIQSLGEHVKAAAVAPDRRSLRAIGEKIFDPRRCPRAARAGFMEAADMLRPVADTWLH